MVLVFCVNRAILILVVCDLHFPVVTKTFPQGCSCAISAEFLRNSVRYQHPGVFPGVDTAIPQISFLLNFDLLLTLKDFKVSRKMFSQENKPFVRRFLKFSALLPDFLQQ